MSSSQTNEASKFTAIKDQAVGAVKEAIGNVFGNNKMELEGKAQKVHGKIEYEYAKAHKEGEVEPQKFQEAYHPQESSNMQEPEHHHAAPIAGQAPPPPAEFVQPAAAHLVQPSAGTIPPPPAPQNQSTEPSQMSAWKDQAVGAMKENWGDVTNNPQMEMEGKAQNLHGKNEAEFAKAKKEGWNEPQHFEHGTKTNEQAQGSVEGDKVSSLSAMKDKTMGSLKENWGSATGNTNTELQGKAQQMHGRNEAEFAKAQKQGLNEPEHYGHGTKTTEHAQGEVVSEDEPSKMSGWKDQAVGSVKESFGNMTNNERLEMKGKAQKMQGSNTCTRADAQKNTINA